MSTLNQIKVKDTLYDIEDKQAREELLNKINKVEGKDLSTNDFTNEHKEKLDGLSNYDDTELRNELGDKANKNEIPSIVGLATEEYVDNAISNLPSGGGSSTSEQMELIASGTNTEPIRRFKITADNDGKPFELTKIFLVVRNLVSNNTDGNQGISIDIQNTTSGLYASLINVALMTNEAKNKDVVAYANEDGLFQAFQGGGGIYSLGTPKISTVFMPNQTITLVNFTCAAALQTFQAGATYELWGVRK